MVMVVIQNTVIGNIIWLLAVVRISVVFHVNSECVRELARQEEGWHYSGEGNGGSVIVLD